MLFSHIKVNFIALYRFLLFRHLALGLPSKNRVETLETRQLEITTCLDPNMSCKEFEIIKLKTNDEFIITYFSVACRVSHEPKMLERKMFFKKKKSATFYCDLRVQQRKRHALKLFLFFKKFFIFAGSVLFSLLMKKAQLLKRKGLSSRRPTTTTTTYWAFYAHKVR